MDFMTAVKSVYNNYATFSGRAPRSEYWWFYLFFMIAYVVLFALGAVIGSVAGIILLVFALGSLIPSIAVGVRRLHDVGKSGWWLLIALVPIAGLLLLWWFIQPSQPGNNQYGANPLGQ